MFSSKTYRSPYPCYNTINVPAVATTAGTTTPSRSLCEGWTHTNALCATLSDNALYLIGLTSLLKDLFGPQAMREALMPAPIETTNRPNAKPKTRNSTY